MKNFVTKTFIFDETTSFYQDLDTGEFFLYQHEIYIKISENASIKLSEKFLTTSFFGSCQVNKGLIN